MKNFNVKMTKAAREYILGHWSQEELASALEKRNGDALLVLKEVINAFFRDRLREGKDYELVKIAKTPQGEDYYKMPNESPEVEPF